MNNIKFILSLTILVFSILSCSLCKDSNKLNTDKEIRYEVTGTSGYVSVTVSNGSGGTEQFNEVTTPWKKTYITKSGHLYVSAQNQRSSGSVVVKIYVDGKVVKESSSEGEYCIASASDWLN